ncbi:MAG: hypothetical protein L0Z50_39820 [Verrucomicrobiales bacterium]|nr:hypothetical protein [Verrucomicrobiales bacterium]
MSVLAKVIFLTTGLVIYFVASQLGAIYRFNQVTRLLDGQAQAVRDQNQIVTASRWSFSLRKSPRRATNCFNTSGFFIVFLMTG